MTRWLVLTLAALSMFGCRSDGSGGPPSGGQVKPVSVPTVTPAPTLKPETAQRLDMVRQALAQGVEVDRADELGRTALMLAAFDGHTEVVGLLLTNGAAVDLLDSVGRSALMYASTGPFPETVEVLLNHGASVDVADTVESWTALMFAAGEGQAEVVQILLRHGADPSLKDADGESAVDHARLRGHPEVARLLEGV